MAPGLRIGHVAKTTGVAAKTIRYYEAVGVLPAVPRTASGYRAYDPSAVERLRFIARARSLGLPLRRLRTLMRVLVGMPTMPLRPTLLPLVEEHLVAVERRIAELEALRRELQDVSRRMRTARPRRHNGACRCLETAGDRRSLRAMPSRRPG
jgi:MerR family transcriptional regulator, copper efflux regulator